MKSMALLICLSACVGLRPSAQAPLDCGADSTIAAEIDRIPEAVNALSGDAFGARQRLDKLLAKNGPTAVCAVELAVAFAAGAPRIAPGQLLQLVAGVAWVQDHSDLVYSSIGDPLGEHVDRDGNLVRSRRPPTRASAILPSEPKVAVAPAERSTAPTTAGHP